MAALGRQYGIAWIVIAHIAGTFVLPPYVERLDRVSQRWGGHIVRVVCTVAFTGTTLPSNAGNEQSHDSRFAFRNAEFTTDAYCPVTAGLSKVLTNQRRKGVMVCLMKRPTRSLCRG